MFKVFLPIQFNFMSTVVQTWACIGVGWENSDFLIALIKFSSKPKWAKLETGFGGLNPDTYDGIDIKDEFY